MSMSLKQRVAEFTWRQWLGWSLIIISSIAWTVLPIIPFLPMSLEAKAAWGGGVFIFAEITWWVAVPLLGKELIELTQRFMAWCKNLINSENESGESVRPETHPTDADNQ